MVETVEPPPEWGRVVMSEFLENARRNMIASFVNYRTEYDRLLAFDKFYREITDCLDNTLDWFCGMFLLKAHASYLSAVELTLTTRLADAFTVLRSCLETSLYGLYVKGHPELMEVWLRRSDDEESKRRARKVFTYRNVIDRLRSIDPKAADTAHTLYERTIDYGGHPNKDSILLNLRKIDKPDAIRFELDYLITTSVAIRLALKTAAQVGFCSLWIFGSLYRERFRILQLDDRLRELGKGL